MPLPNTFAKVIVVLAAVAGASGVAVSTIAAGQRDPVPTAAPAVATPAPTGTSHISGRIVADSQGRPVRRSIVTLTGGELPRSLSTITDDGGRFAFDGLPAGRFVVTASKPGYLTTAFGTRQPGRPGTAVVVTEGQRVTTVEFQLPEGSVITGTVRNQYGEPLSGVAVFAGRPGLDRPGAGQVTALGDIKTDDRGVYRIFGLEPGSYVVGVIQRIGGGATTAPTEREISDTLAALQRATPAPGRSAPTQPVAPPAPIRTSSLAPIFFPGTSDFSQAQQVVVRMGEERSGVDVVFRPVPAVQISGTIAGPGGGDVPAVQIGFASDAVVQLPGFSPVQPLLVQAPGRDGRFAYTGVIPGKYTLTVRTMAAPQPPPGTTVGSAGGSGGGSSSGGGGAASPFTPQPDALWGLATVTVTDSDVEGISLSLGSGLRIAGRLEFDATSLAPPTSFADIRMVLAPRREGGLTMMNGTLFGTLPPPAATIGADRTLDFRGLVPGVYQLNATWPAGKGWWLKSAVADGTDILDIPLEISTDGRLPQSIVVTYSDRQTELSGVLQTAGGAPAPDYFIIAFSTDQRTWRPQARRLASTRPATDGGFTLRNLPPGDYYLAALTDLDPAEWQAPAFLSQLAPVALRFTLTDGQKLRQDLRVQ